MSRSKIAIVAALEREVRPLVKTWRVSQREHDGRTFRFFENRDAVVVCGGMGAEAARRASEAVIAVYAPAIVYSAGFAGALDPKLKVGDLVEPWQIVNAGDGSRVTLSGHHSRTGAELCSAGQPHSTPPREARGPSGQTGAAVPACVLVSFGLVASPEQKAKLREAFAAAAVDMEAAAVAKAAEARGVGFAALKVISDDAEFRFPALERFVDGDGQFREARFALFAAVRPWLWLRVARLGSDSGRAARALCGALREKILNPASVLSECR